MDNNDNIRLYIKNNKDGRELDLITVGRLIESDLEPAARKRLKGELSKEALADIVQATKEAVEAACAPYRTDDRPNLMADLFLHVSGLTLDQYSFISEFSETAAYKQYKATHPGFENALEDLSLVSVNENSKSVYSLFKKIEEDFCKGKLYPLKTVENYNLLNDKAGYAIVGNFFARRDIDGQTAMDFAINEADKKSVPVPVYITLIYDGEENFNLSRRISAYDESVINAICTFSYYGKDNFTETELWRLMNGYHGNLKKNPSVKQAERLMQSIEKLSSTRLIMDISKELAAGYITIDDERIVDGVVRTYFLPAESCSLRTENGRIVAGYNLIKEPFFFTYHKAKRHVITVPYDLLETGGGTTGYFAEFRDFMLKRIASMNAGVIKKHTIDLAGSDSIYKYTGVPLPEGRINREDYALQQDYRAAVRRVAANDRNVISEILKSWESKKFIRGFELEKGANNQYTDVKIRPNLQTEKLTRSNRKVDTL